MPDDSQEVNSVSQRHWLYGFNVSALVAIGLVMLGFIMVLGENARGKASMDWSSNGINSLSGSTKSLLKEINKGTQEYQILSLFTDPRDEERRNGDPAHQAEHRRQVNDLLRLYANGSSKIHVEDDGDVALDDIERRVRDKFKNELVPYQKAVDDFDPVAKKLSDFLKSEGDRISASVLQGKPTENEMQGAASLQAQLREISKVIESIQHRVRQDSEEVNPKWTEMTDDIKSKMDSFTKVIDFFADPAKIKESLKESGIEAPALMTYFNDASSRYKAMGESLKAYQDSLNKLQTPKIQDALSGLGRNSIVILGPDSAKVLSQFDVFDSQASQAGNAESAPRIVFKGEEVLSSALLALNKPDKVKVIFVTATPQNLLTDLYSDMAGILRDNNFDVQEWSPPGPPNPQNPTPPSPTPPAEGKGVVWVVFPPDPPNEQMMMMGAMPNADAVIAAVKKHMDAGGQVLFFAEASAASPMGALGGAGYPYDPLVKPFGINVQPKYAIVQMVEGEDPNSGQRVSQIAPYIEITRYEDHDITRPIQSLATAFYPTRSVTAVDVASPLPGGVEAKVLVKTPYTSDFWGESQFSPDAKFDKDSDLAPPVGMAAASIRDKGQKDEQRIVVIGCKALAGNAVLEAIRGVRVGDEVIPTLAYPGNQELMRNSILWLAGYENMIAVSTKVNAAVRIGDVSPAELTGIRVGVLAGAPLLALFIGGLIWFVRHR